jgi:hypothetical protein
MTFKTGFGLDDWIYCILDIHAFWNYRQSQRYRSTTHFPVHCCTRIRVLVLTSRIPATDLSHSHCNFQSHTKSSLRSLIPSLPLFCSSQFRRLDFTTLDYCSILLLLFCRTLSYNHFARTTRKRPSSVVKDACLLVRNGWPIVACACCGNVFTEPLPINGYTHRNMIKAVQLEYLLRFYVSF